MPSQKRNLESALLRFFCCILLSIMMALGGREAKAKELQIGRPAPDFALPDETGKKHHLADYRGRTVVIMFYPKDFTPG